MKRGRPRGINVNPEAVEALRVVRSMSKAELCEAAGITQGHFIDMLRRGKGASPSTIRALAVALQVTPGAIAPELTGLFVAVRDGDEVAA